MKVKVVKEFESEIFEISQLEEHSVPVTYQKPYFIVVESTYSNLKALLMPLWLRIS